MDAREGGSTARAGERRYDLRVPVPVFVHSARQWRAGRLHNVSASGAFITLDADVWVGEEVEIVLGFPEKAGGRRKLRALTVWRTLCEDRGRATVTAGYGLLFPPQPETEAGLDAVIHRLERNGMARASGRPPREV